MGQIQKVVLALGDYMNVQCHSCIGGTNLGEDIRKLDYGQHVVSGTPGRVFDMIRRRTLRTRGIKMLVLDEADEMLNKGFKDLANVEFETSEDVEVIPTFDSMAASSCLTLSGSW